MTDAELWDFFDLEEVKDLIEALDMAYVSAPFARHAAQLDRWLKLKERLERNLKLGAY